MKRYHKISLFKAFSLIELMVTIGIIGVLAAIAVPAYNNYLVSARMTKAAKAVDDLVDQSILFSAGHGRFAQAYDLGLTTSVGSGTPNDSTMANIVPYYDTVNQNAQIREQGYYGANGGPCGAWGTIYLKLDADSLGVSDPSQFSGQYAGIYLRCDFWNYSGVIYKYCTYNPTTCNSGGAGCSTTSVKMSGWPWAYDTPPNWYSNVSTNYSCQGP